MLLYSADAKKRNFVSLLLVVVFQSSERANKLIDLVDDSATIAQRTE